MPALYSYNKEIQVLKEQEQVLLQENKTLRQENAALKQALYQESARLKKLQENGQNQL